MDSTQSKSSKVRNSLTKSSFNISNGVQSDGRVVLATDRSLHLEGSVPCESDTHHLRVPIMAKPICWVLVVCV